jgi:two-component system NtrC family response regulator
VILIAAFASEDTAVEAIKAGAYDYVTKPIEYEALLPIICRAMERPNPDEGNLRSALNERYGFENIVGSSKGLLSVLEMASRVAQHDSTVLILGETGTGKNLLARAIHHNSQRKDKPFATINCGATRKELIEAELFGFQSGAVAGAQAAKPGKIERADGGTVYLEDVGELPLEMQAKLLRLLQHGEIEKIGSTGYSAVNVRVIASTNRNLQTMIQNGAFREDLYYRLAVVPLELLPLRKRKEDLPGLVQHLFQKLKARHGFPSMRVSPSVTSSLSSYHWPGNVRELENVIERMLVLSARDEITEADLPDEIRGLPATKHSFLPELPEHGISLEGVERELLVRALERFNGNQTQAARYLNISRRTLIYRMEKHGLRRESDMVRLIGRNG